MTRRSHSSAKSPARRPQVPAKAESIVAKRRSRSGSVAARHEGDRQRISAGTAVVIWRARFIHPDERTVVFSDPDEREDELTSSASPNATLSCVPLQILSTRGIHSSHEPNTRRSSPHRFDCRLVCDRSSTAESRRWSRRRCPSGRVGVCNQVVAWFGMPGKHVEPSPRDEISLRGRRERPIRYRSEAHDYDLCGCHPSPSMKCANERTCAAWHV